MNPSSKVCFINLDGYESEYNLECARSFKRKMMYISFPKESISDETDQVNYSKRMYKKMMFMYS